eukprot:Gb_33642 [translate_table: standard]
MYSKCAFLFSLHTHNARAPLFPLSEGLVGFLCIYKRAPLVFAYWSKFSIFQALLGPALFLHKGDTEDLRFQLVGGIDELGLLEFCPVISPNYARSPSDRMSPVRFIMEVIERSVEAQVPQYDCLLFDLDDTLYPLSSGLQAACRKNIEEYMVQKLNIDESKVPEMCIELYKKHGTTMAGLKASGYDFDNDDFHSFVHGRLPYENLRPDPVLRNLLLSMPQRKIALLPTVEQIFTNADKVHAAKVLSRLGLEDCFDGVICFETLNPCDSDLNPCPHATDKDDDFKTSNPCPQSPGISGGLETTNSETTNSETVTSNEPNAKSLIACKPSLEAIELAISIANTDPKRTIFFDDSVRNIAAGKVAGLHTVLVGTSIRTEGADFALRSIHNIKEALPEIWENEEKSEIAVGSSQAIAVETFVVA